LTFIFAQINPFQVEYLPSNFFFENRPTPVCHPVMGSKKILKNLPQ